MPWHKKYLIVPWNRAPVEDLIWKVIFKCWLWNIWQLKIPTPCGGPQTSCYNTKFLQWAVRVQSARPSTELIRLIVGTSARFL